MTAVYVLVGALALLVLWVALSYISLVKARNRVDEAWRGIEVHLKRRHDLVPGLVKTIQGYSSHERSTLQSLTAARAGAVLASEPAAVEATEARLTSVLEKVNAMAESYPELCGTERFRRLQAELARIEDEIQAARRIYNENVQQYNTRTLRFPTLLVAGPLAFGRREFFEVETPPERSVPQVVFQRLTDASQ